LPAARPMQDGAGASARRLADFSNAAHFNRHPHGNVRVRPDHSS